MTLGLRIFHCQSTRRVTDDKPIICLVFCFAEILRHFIILVILPLTRSTWNWTHSSQQSHMRRIILGAILAYGWEEQEGGVLNTRRREKGTNDLLPDWRTNCWGGRNGALRLVIVSYRPDGWCCWWIRSGNETGFICSVKLSLFRAGVYCQDNCRAVQCCPWLKTHAAASSWLKCPFVTK